MSLADLYEKLAAVDHEAQAEQQEHEKLAAEEEAAGRITARGFMDELNKLAASAGPPSAVQGMVKQRPPAKAPMKQYKPVKAPTSGAIAVGKPKLTYGK